MLHLKRFLVYGSASLKLVWRFQMKAVPKISQYPSTTETFIGKTFAVLNLVDCIKKFGEICGAKWSVLIHGLKCEVCGLCPWCWSFHDIYPAFWGGGDRGDLMLDWLYCFKSISLSNCFRCGQWSEGDEAWVDRGAADGCVLSKDTKLRQWNSLNYIS